MRGWRGVAIGPGNWANSWIVNWFTRAEWPETTSTSCQFAGFISQSWFSLRQDSLILPIWIWFNVVDYVTQTYYGLWPSCYFNSAFFVAFFLFCSLSWVVYTTTELQKISVWIVKASHVLCLIGQRRSRSSTLRAQSRLYRKLAGKADVGQNSLDGEIRQIGHGATFLVQPRSLKKGCNITKPKRSALW